MKKRIIILLGASTLLCGCNIDELIGSMEIGQPIVFSANTAYSNGTPTRTEYSGRDENNSFVSSSSSWERIDWVDGDLIRIWCDQELSEANYRTDATDHFADYRVKSHSETSDDWRTSTAELQNYKSNGLTWSDAKSHTFYAMYPSPATTGVDTDKVKMDGNKLSGTIPASQTRRQKSGSTTFFLPDMNYAYMWAAKKSNPGATVSLQFKPLMTAFEFTVDSDGEDEMLLYSFSMTSSANLTGDFTATVNEALDGFMLDVTGNAAKTVTVDFGGTENPTVIHKGNPITFTVFTLPQEIPDLTIRFMTSFGTKFLELKQNDEWVPFPGCKKIRITGLGVPGEVDPWTYHLSDLSSIELGYAGGTGTSATNFFSYRSDGEVTERIPFELWYSTDGGQTWSKTPPSDPDKWVVTPSFGIEDSYPGYLAADKKKLQFTLSNAHYRDLLPYDDIHAEELRSRPHKEDFDLSTLNVATGEIVAPERYSTANCYVVQAPGSYKFPLVKGNAIKNGEDNVMAYRVLDENIIGSKQQTYSVTKQVYDSWKEEAVNYTIGNESTDKQIQNLDSSPIIYPSSCELLWMNKPGLVTDVEIDGAYIKFTVPEESICQGNAIIAAKNSGGTILWSWHIWVTDEDLTVHRNVAGTRYMPTVNLGAIDGIAMESPDYTCLVYAVQPDAPESVKNSQRARRATIHKLATRVNMGGSKPFYQWGRKDPMYRTNGSNFAGNGRSFDKLDVGNKKKMVTSSTYVTAIIEPAYHWYRVSLKTRTDISTSIKNPMTFYYSFGYNYFVNTIENEDGTTTTTEKRENPWYANWSAKMYVNLWNPQWPNGPVVKSIFDPCPVGFMIPDRYALSGLEDQLGARGLRFPADSCMSAQSGSIIKASAYSYQAYDSSIKPYISNSIALWSNMITSNYMHKTNAHGDYFIEFNEIPQNGFAIGPQSWSVPLNTGLPIRPMVEIDFPLPQGGVSTGGMELTGKESDAGGWENKTN